METCTVYGNLCYTWKLVFYKKTCILHENLYLIWKTVFRRHHDVVLHDPFGMYVMQGPGQPNG